jgi:hypothetical protein
MKRFLTVLAALTMTGITVNAQSYSGSTEYNKTPQPAAIAELPYGAGMVEDAIKYKMEKMGFSGKETKGFRTYKSIKVPEKPPRQRCFLRVYAREQGQRPFFKRHT